MVWRGGGGVVEGCGVLWRGVAHRNETAVGLGGGPRPKNSAAVRPADSAGRDRRGGFQPKIWPTPPGGGPAGRIGRPNCRLIPIPPPPHVPLEKAKSPS